MTQLLMDGGRDQGNVGVTVETSGASIERTELPPRFEAGERAAPRWVRREGEPEWRKNGKRKRKKLDKCGKRET